MTKSANSGGSPGPDAARRCRPNPMSPTCPADTTFAAVRARGSLCTCGAETGRAGPIAKVVKSSKARATGERWGNFAPPQSPNSVRAKALLGSGLLVYATKQIDACR
jgi:hypothetical protein